MVTRVTSTSSDLARLSELIDSIYAGATDPSHWSTVVPAIADWTGAKCGLLFTPLNAPENGGFYFTHAIPEHFMELWGTHYHSHDIWAQRANERGLLHESNVINGDQVVPFEELNETVFYQEFLSKQGIAHLLTGVVFGLDSPQTNTAVVCSLFRGLEQGVFTVVEQERLALLVPHLSRALGVMTRLRDLEFRVAASLATLERLSTGVLLFNAKGSATFANQAALHTLDENDGLLLRHVIGSSDLGELLADDSKAQLALSTAIGSAIAPDLLRTEHFSRAVSIPRPSGRQDYTLNFSSLAANNEFGSGPEAPRAIAFITDTSEPVRLDGELMKQTYGLTAAEIRIAEMLAECMTVDETAKRLSLSRSTVKAHQQHIYEKTGTNSRAKLMKLLMSLAQMASLVVMFVSDPAWIAEGLYCACDVCAI